MKILIGFKVEPDFTMLPESGWQADSANNIDTAYARKINNCYDESAAELALSFREQNPDVSVELTAFCLGTADIEFSLYPLLALGFDSAVRIDLPENTDSRFNPHAVAKTFAAWHARIAPQSLILLGAQSGEGGNAQTPALVAEFLNWPLLTNVTGFSQTPTKDVLKITRKTESGQQILEIRLPAVLSIGNSPDSAYLRQATLMQKLAAKNRRVSVHSLTELGVDFPQKPADKALQTLKRVKASRTVHMIDGANAAEKTQHLYTDFLKRWLNG